MAETTQQIEARLRADPAYAVLTRVVNGAAQTLTAAERDARIAEEAAAIRQQHLDAEAAAALKTLRAQVRTARARLQQIHTAAPPFSNAQRDAAIQDTARFLDGLIGVLIDLNLIERE